MNKKEITPNSKKEKELFPPNLFGKCKDTTDSKKVIEKAKKELEEKQNHKPELTLFEQLEKKELNKQLLKASTKGDLEKVKELLNKGADVNAKGEYGRTPLMWVLREANIEISELLIEKGADLNVQDDEGKTVLMCASWGGARGVLLLLQYPEIKLDMEILTKEFTKASDRGDLKLVKELLPKVDVNAISHKGRNGLILASRHNYLDCVSVILNDPRTDVNLKDSIGNTALMYASEYGYTDVVSLLLKHPKIDVNIKDDNGQTALVEAVYKEHYDIVSLLIDKGANISSLDCLFRVNFKNLLKYVIKKFEGVLV